ncbi:MAG: S-layer homology domain-containing protein [Clostridia bacterium]|nr:S-layer homology domain-containing protein [Clostridia bacterium]
MRRLVCLMLCFTMLFSGVSLSFAEGSVNAEREIKILSALGIFSDAVPGENLVTRGEFATYLAEYLYETNEPKVQFADVGEDSPYLTAITTVAAAGAMRGTSEYIFAPDNHITVPEAVKAILHILGYDILAQAEGGYPAGYMTVANRVDLLSGIKESGEINQNLMFKLLYNALEIPFAQRDSYGSDEFGLKETGDNILNTRFEIEHVKRAKVNSNGYSYVSSNRASNVNTVELDGVQFMDKNSVLKDMLGYSVEFFYSDDDDRNILFALPYAGCTVKEISALDVLRFSQNVLEYELPDQTSRTITVSASADYIFNGRYAEYTSLTANDFKNCTFRLIDADSDGSYETVHLEKIVNYVVDYKKAQPQTILDTISGDSLNLEDYENVIMTFDDGKKGVFSDIGTNDVLSVVASKDKELLRIIISSQSFGGSVEQVLDDEIVIGGKNYKVADELKNSKYNPALTDSGVFVLDALGRVAMFIRNASAGQWRYGYIIEGGIRTEKMEKFYALRILEQSGKSNVYNLAEKCEIDGVVVKDVTSARYENLKMDYRVNPPVNRGVVTPMVIRYSLNADSEINGIDTETYDSANETEFSLYSKSGYMDANNMASSSDKGLMYNYPDYTFGHRVAVDTSSQIFKVPYDYDDKKEFKYNKITTAELEHSKHYCVKGFNENDAKIASVVVVYDNVPGGGSSWDRERSFFLIDSVGEAYVDGDVVPYLKGWMKREYKTFYIENDVRDLYLTTNIWGNTVAKTEFRQGDILQLKSDAYNYITDFRIVYNVEERYDYVSQQLHWNEATSVMPAFVYDKVGGLFLLGYGWDALKSEAAMNAINFADLGTTGMGWGSVYIYDEEKGTTRMGTTEDFNTVLGDGLDASRVFYRTTYGCLEDIVVIKLKDNK